MLVLVGMIVGSLILAVLPGAKSIEMKAGTRVVYVEGKGMVPETIPADEEPMIEPDMSKWKYPENYGEALTDQDMVEIRNWDMQ